MIESRYTVIVNGKVSAKGMPIDDVAIFIKALLKEYTYDIHQEVRIIDDISYCLEKKNESKNIRRIHS